MIVILDSNIIIQDYGLRSTPFREFKEFLSQPHFNLVIPEIVIDEVVAHLKRDLQDRAREVNRFKKLCEKVSECHFLKQLNVDTQIDSIMSHYEKDLRNKLSELNCEFLDFRTVPIEEVVHKLVNRKKPIKSDGTGVGDTIIWEAVKACSKRDRVALVTEDINDFAGTDGNPHSDMASELTESDFDIIMFKSIFHFLKVNTTEENKVANRIMTDEAFKLLNPVVDIILSKQEMFIPLAEEFLSPRHSDLRALTIVGFDVLPGDFIYRKKEGSTYEVIVRYESKMQLNFIYKWFHKSANELIDVPGFATANGETDVVFELSDQGLKFIDIGSSRLKDVQELDNSGSLPAVNLTPLIEAKRSKEE